MSKANPEQPELIEDEDGAYGPIPYGCLPDLVRAERSFEFHVSYLVFILKATE